MSALRAEANHCSLELDFISPGSASNRPEGAAAAHVSQHFGKCTNAPALSRCSVSEAVNAVAASTHSTHTLALGLALLNASLQDFARQPQNRHTHHVSFGGHQAMLMMMHHLYLHFVLKPTIAVLNLTSSIQGAPVIGLKALRLHIEPAPSSGKCTNAPALSRCSVSEAVNAVAASTHSTHTVAFGLALLNASLQDFARRPQRRRVPHVSYGGHQAMLIVMHRLYPQCVLRPTIASSAPLLSQLSLPMRDGCQEWSAVRRVLLWRPNFRTTGTRARSHEDNAPPTCVSTVIASVFA